MDDSENRQAATMFFDEFVEAFHTFDGNVIARRYLPPCLMLHADGAIDCFSSSSEIAEYFQKIVDDYRKKGCRSCRYQDLEVVSIGRQSALGTVTWELLREDGSVLSAWREAYNLVRAGDRFLVFASVDHAD